MHKLLIHLLLIFYAFLSYSQTEIEIDTIIFKGGKSMTAQVKSVTNQNVTIEVNNVTRSFPSLAIEDIKKYQYKHLDTIVMKNGDLKTARIIGRDRFGSNFVINYQGNEIKLAFDLIQDVRWYNFVFPKNENQEIGFSKVIEIPNKAKDEIYDITKEWLVEVFNDAGEVIQIDDKNLGKIIAKGFFKTTYDDRVGFILKILIKDEKLKVDIYNLDIPFETWRPESFDKFYKWMEEGMRRGEDRKILIAMACVATMATLEDRVLGTQNEDEFKF